MCKKLVSKLILCLVRSRSFLRNLVNPSLLTRDIANVHGAAWAKAIYTAYIDHGHKTTMWGAFFAYPRDSAASDQDLVTSSWISDSLDRRNSYDRSS